jgi:hypothetical protein
LAETLAGFLPRLLHRNVSFKRFKDEVAKLIITTTVFIVASNCSAIATHSTTYTRPSRREPIRTHIMASMQSNKTVQILKAAEEGKYGVLAVIA